MNDINRIRVMVVEDSQTQAEIIRYLLEKHNYEVTVAGDGKQAYEILSTSGNHLPSLVITDILMPEMDGYELCKKIKSEEHTENIPVVLLTSLFDINEVIEGLLSGADSFVTKPFNNEFLISHVEKLINKNLYAGVKSETLDMEVNYEEMKSVMSIKPQKTIDYLLCSYQVAIQKNNQLLQTQDELRVLNTRLESIVEERTSALSEEIKTSKQNAEELRESEEKWHTLVTTIPDYVALHDMSGRFQFLNHYAEGFSEKDTIGKSLFDFISLESRETYREKFKTCISTRENQVFEYHAFGDKGVINTYIGTLVPIIQNENVINVMAIGQDITDRKLTEAEILHKTKQLQSLNSEKDKFFSIIAHDLRSPFQGLLYLTELMAEGKESFTVAELTEFSKSLNTSANNICKLLENLLEWAMIQNDSGSFDPKEVAFSAIVDQNIRLMEERAVQKGITIVNKVPDNQKIYADEKMIDAILRNLMSNAVKFTIRGGKVNIKSEIIGKRLLEISVTDTGIGMSEGLIEKLFKIDGQIGSKGTDGEPGTGLGLILCKEFVEKHSGKIWVESEEGRGSKFMFTIPLRQ